MYMQLVTWFPGDALRRLRLHVITTKTTRMTTRMSRTRLIVEPSTTGNHDKPTEKDDCVIKPINNELN